MAVEEAWIGDAVLALYARLKILREDGRVDGEKCKRLTSNRFLGTLGEPTKVEAQVGRVFASEGLEGAFRWIDQHLLPLFERQEANRLRRGVKD
jgi:dsRNA-specific ribonuclease